MSRIATHLRARCAAYLALCIALLVLGGPAVSSDAFAAAKRLITGKDVKDSSLTGADIKNGSLVASDFKRGQLPAGAQGPAGAAGAPGPAGVAGAQGPTGPRGADGTFLAGPLPSGTTVRGAYAINGNTDGMEPALDEISFGWEMPSPLAAHVILDDPTTECPGTPQAPEALPGHLCVYHDTSGGGPTLRVGIAPGNFGSTFTSGAILVLTEDQPITGPFNDTGTWAATAP